MSRLALTFCVAIACGSAVLGSGLIWRPASAQQGFDYAKEATPGAEIPDIHACKVEKLSHAMLALPGIKCDVTSDLGIITKEADQQSQYFCSADGRIYRASDLGAHAYETRCTMSLGDMRVRFLYANALQCGVAEGLSQTALSGLLAGGPFVTERVHCPSGLHPDARTEAGKATIMRQCFQQTLEGVRKESGDLTLRPCAPNSRWNGFNSEITRELGLDQSLNDEFAHPVSAGPTLQDCPELCPKMALIPAGSFLMGVNDGHRVTIAKPFAMAKYDVTRADYARFVAETNWKSEDHCWKGDDHTGPSGISEDANWRSPGITQSDLDPVVCVSFADVQAYIEWLNRKTHQTYRLPSEAEWEYATRAGSITTYWWGQDINRGCEFDNLFDTGSLNQHVSDREISFAISHLYVAANCSDGYLTFSPVGAFKPNPFGLYDMVGDARQYMADCWHVSVVDAPSNGSPWIAPSCRYHVIRGAGWYESAWQMSQSGYRSTWGGQAHFDLGFRLAKSL